MGNVVERGHVIEAIVLETAFVGERDIMSFHVFRRVDFVEHCIFITKDGKGERGSMGTRYNLGFSEQLDLLEKG